MSNLRCENCKHCYRAVVGVVECSFAPEGYIDQLRFECRRFPPSRGFWNSGYPEIVGVCGEYQEKNDEA